jgi:hypothetical protein
MCKIKNKETNGRRKKYWKKGREDEMMKLKDKLDYRSTDVTYKYNLKLHHTVM